MRRPTVTFYLTGILGFVGAPLVAQALNAETTKKIREHYTDALAQYKDKQYAKSNAAYEQVLSLLPAAAAGKVDPNRARIQFEIARNHALLGSKPEAIQSLERAVEHGFWDTDMLRQDPSLKDVRNEKPYAAIVDRAKVGLGRMVAGLTDVVTGKKVELADLKDKVVIVDIWGTWCPPCRAEIPYFVKLQHTYGARGLQIVGLTHERQPDPEAARKGVNSFAKSQGVNYPLVMLEPDLYALLSGLYGLRSFPTTYFFGRDGTVKHRVEGLHPYESLEAKVLPLLAEKVAATPPSR